MHKKNARLITPGNLEDDLALLGDCDWIIEVVIENLAIKHKVYQAIDAARRPRVHRLLQHLDHSAKNRLGRGTCRDAFPPAIF